MTGVLKVTDKKKAAEIQLSSLNLLLQGNQSKASTKRLSYLSAELFKTLLMLIKIKTYNTKEGKFENKEIHCPRFKI